jgi:hypothetical protein
MCAMEFGAYLAGLEHTDKPACVSPILLTLMISFNDQMDDKTRQRLRPYIVRTLGTAGDGQDERRGYIAADWAVRECVPIGLDAAGCRGEARTLRSLAPVVDMDSARAAYAAAYAAYAAARAAYAASEAAAYAAYAAANPATYPAAYVAAYVTKAATYAAKAASYASYAAAEVAVWDSAFGLLDRIIDPRGIHDVRAEAEWLAALERLV